MDLSLARQVGIAAAHKGAEILSAYFGKIKQVKKKGAIDLVTEADTASEAAIVATIKKAFPNHSILAEEGGLNRKESTYQWFIDPLDGTTNYTHQVPMWAISIGCAVRGEPVLGVVLNPMSGELFTGVKGGGAALNGRPVRVSRSATVSDSLLVTGFPYNFQSIMNPLMARFARCLEASQGVRRLGSAALDICFVACGRFDAFWEQGLNPWDTAAAVCIASEAGAITTDFSNRPFNLYNHEILVANPNIHLQMLSLLENEIDTTEDDA